MNRLGTTARRVLVLHALEIPSCSALASLRSRLDALRGGLHGPRAGKHVRPADTRKVPPLDFIHIVGSFLAKTHTPSYRYLLT